MRAGAPIARGEGGYTVVEFVLTVLIFATLAVIAVPKVRGFHRKASNAEARSNLGAIRSTEVAYFAEWNAYVGNQPFTPVRERRFNDKPVPWNPGTRFSLLGFAPEGPVVHSYSLEEGADFPNYTPLFTAKCDLDRDGVLSFYALADVYTPTTKERLQKVPKEVKERLRGKVPEGVIEEWAREWESECEKARQRPQKVMEF